MPSPGWVTTDPEPQRPPARASKGWAPRPHGKVKLMTGWNTPEQGAGAEPGQAPGQAPGIGPQMPLAPALQPTSPWAEDLRRSSIPSAVPMPPTLTAPATPAIPSSGPSTPPATAAPSPGTVGVLGSSAAAPAQSPVRVPPQGGQATASQPPPQQQPDQPALGGLPQQPAPQTSSSSYPAGTPSQAPTVKTPTPSQPGDLIDQARQAAIAAGVDPDVFSRQIQQESGFNPNAKSPAGAVGIAQFMPDTAKGLGINPSDPQQALSGAAKLMRTYLDMYHGDYRKALAAYNAGPGAVDKYGDVPPYAETQHYVDAIYGNGPATSPMSANSNSPQAVHAAPIQGQFEMGLSTADAYAFCGPAAAMAFAASYGRNPTPAEAKQLAAKVGWNPSQGMAGVGSEQKLLESMGIATRLEDKLNWDHVATDAANGNPVIIDTPGHYYYIDGYDANAGKFHVGKSGTSLKGGSEWMTASEINGMPQSEGHARAALFADHPLSTTPSMFVSGQSKPNDQATGTAALGPPGNLPPEWQALWNKPIMGGGQEDQGNSIIDASGQTASTKPPASPLDALKQAGQDALKRQYPILGPGGLGVVDPRLGSPEGDEGTSLLGDAADINLGGVAKGASDVEDPAAYPGGGPGYAVPEGPPSPPKAPAFDLQTLDKAGTGMKIPLHGYTYDPADEAVHQFRDPVGTDLVVVKDTTTHGATGDTQYLYVNQNTGEIINKVFADHDFTPAELETNYQNWLNGGSPGALLHQGGQSVTPVTQGSPPSQGLSANQSSSMVVGTPPPHTPGVSYPTQPVSSKAWVPNIATSFDADINPQTGLMSIEQELLDEYSALLNGASDAANNIRGLGADDPNGVLQYALDQKQAGRPEFLNNLQTIAGHQVQNYSVSKSVLSDPIADYRGAFKAQYGDMQARTPGGYDLPHNFNPTLKPPGKDGGYGEIHSAGVYTDTDFNQASDRFGALKSSLYARVYQVPTFQPGELLDLKNDPNAAQVMDEVHKEATALWHQGYSSNAANPGSSTSYPDFGQLLNQRLQARGIKAVYGGGFADENGELMFVDDPEKLGAKLVADGPSNEVMTSLKTVPGWNPQVGGLIVVGVLGGGAAASQSGQASPQAQGAGADDGSDDDKPWWQRAGQGVADLPGALGGAAHTVAQGVGDVVGGAASALGTAAQAVVNAPDPDPQASIGAPPKPPDARSLADVAATADQPRPDTLTPLSDLPDKGQELLDQGKTMPHLATPDEVPARRSLIKPDQPPADTPDQPALPQPAPDVPMTAIEKVTRGQTGKAQGVKPGDLGSMVDSIARDPVADIGDDGYRAQLRKDAAKATINVDGGPLTMLFDPTIAAFGTQAPVQVAINAMFGQDPLTGIVTQGALGVGGKALGRVVAPLAPAKFVAQAAQKTMQALQLPANLAARGAEAGVNSLITRGLDAGLLSLTRTSLTDSLDAHAQADVLEAAGAYLRDPSLDAEALRLRRLTNLVRPLTGQEMASQVRNLAQKAGKPELADEILKNAGYHELTSPYTTAVQRLASLPARGIPEVARSSTNLIAGATLGSAMAAIYPSNKNDPNYDSKLINGAGIGAGALIGMPYASKVLSTTIAPNLLAAAREFAGNLGNLRAPTQAIMKDFISQKQVIDYLRKQMADDIGQAFGPRENWPTVFKYLEEKGTLPPELQGSRKAQAVWQEILDSNARALARGDINDVTTMSPRTLGFNTPRAYLHHAVDSDWSEALRGAERYDPTPPRAGGRGNPIAQYTKPRDWATTTEGEHSGGVKYNYDLDKILSNQWANQQQQALNEVLEGNLRGIAVDPTALGAGANAVDHDVLADVKDAFLPKGYAKGHDVLPDLNISPQLRSSLNRLYNDRGIQSVPGLGKVYQGVTKFFSGLKVGMIAGSGFHMLNEWNQLGASQGMWDAESHLPELTQMAFSRGAWRNFLDGHQATITHAIGDGLTFDPFTQAEKLSWSRVAQVGLLSGGGYATGFTTAKQRGKTDQEAAAWGAVGAGLGAGMAAPFFGKNGALVDVFTDSLFHRTIPMMKLQAYLAHGATPEAAMFANEAFGGINSDAILRSRWFSDTARLAGFAPDWTEGFWRQAGRALWDTGSTGQMQRQFWANAALNGAYMVQGLNLALSGHWSWQNEPGHELQVETTGLYDKNGWSRVPEGSVTGVPIRTYMDIIPAWRSMLDPPLETARWLLASAASTPQGQQLGLDNPRITGMDNGVQTGLKPDPAKAWGTYLTNRLGLIPATVQALHADTDYAGRPLNQPGDTGLDRVARSMQSGIQKLSPLGPAQGITQALRGEPIPMAIFSGATGLRESQSSPSAQAAGIREQIREETTGKNLAQQRALDDQRLQYNQVQDQKALKVMDDPNLTPAQRLQQARQFAHQNVDSALEAQVPPEIRMQSPDTAAGMIAQINAVNKATQTSASSDPADLPVTGEVNPDDLFNQSWNADPSMLAGKTPDQQWLIRQQWTVQTARNNGLDEKVVEDVVKSHLYGIQMPAVPGVSSLELDQLADDWKSAGADAEPASQSAQRQELLNDYAKQKGVDPNALSARVRLRVLLANDQSPNQQSYSRALTVLEAAHNPATAPGYVNEDGTPMGTPDDWVKWDIRLKANSDKYDKPHGRYLDPQLQVLSEAKARGSVKPAETAYRSKDYSEYERWFGVGRNMSDDNWKKYQAGTLEMWTDKPAPQEALNRNNILGLYAMLTPTQRASGNTTVAMQWHGKTYPKLQIKYAVKLMGLLKSGKWQELGLDPGIDPGAPGVDTGFD